MNLAEAKQLLQKQGYRLIKETRQLNERLSYTPEEIFDELWDRSYKYWGDDADYNNFKRAFIIGYAGEDYNDDRAAKDAYEDGVKFNSCETDTCVQNLLADLTCDEWYED
jgi:hypothetical protein